MAHAQRILVCCHDFAPGGTERIAVRMARHWAEAGRDVTFMVGTVEGGLRATVNGAIAVEELNPPIRRSLTSRFALGRAMAARLPQIAPDIVFVPGNFHLQLCLPLHAAREQAGAATAIVAKLSNPITPHGAWAPLLRAVVRRYRHCVDGVAAMNSGIAREAQALAPGVDVRTLYDPVYLNPELIHPHVPAADGRFHIVWAGRFEPQKDFALALATAAALKQGGAVPFHLTMLGSGRQFAAAEAAVQRLGLGDVVTLAGQVPGIDPWLDRADALLITSHYEGGPAVAVEALAHGVPVVSTNCSDFLADTLTIPEAGRIVTMRTPGALAEALAALAAAGPPDPALLAGLITHLAPDHCAEAYLGWFDEIVARRAKGR